MSGQHDIHPVNHAWYCALEIRDHFEALSPTEKLYAHWISRASFLGSRIIIRQNAFRGEEIFELIQEIFRCCKGQWESLIHSVNISKQDMAFFLDYAAQFLSSYGYFTISGGQKFFPQLSRERFEKLASCSEAATTLFQELRGVIYGTESLSLGYPDSGTKQISSYYPGCKNLNKDDVAKIHKILQHFSISLENTRLCEVSTPEGTQYEVLVASIEESRTVLSEDSLRIVLVYGDHRAELVKINEALQNAIPYAATKEQRKALECYIETFRTGDIGAHKRALSQWVRDRAPVVEILLGFVEYYRDPASMRGEWRGCVMIQNQVQTEVFATLVEHAERYIGLLPWSREFDMERFSSPGFTSMEALTFVSTNIPAGTNGPNYEDVKRECGFKNISIRNRVIQTSTPDSLLLSKSDGLLYAKLSTESFGVLVALHELLGHGTGKDLAEISPGIYNFDPSQRPWNPLTGKPIESWYHLGQNWKSFLGSSYEECRCELVALYLILFDEVIQAFGFEQKGIEVEDIIYTAYLYVIRQGLIGLETWNPHTKTWGKAHARARYAITRYLMQLESNVLVLHKDESQSNIILDLDRSRLYSHIKPAMKELLLQLHIFKSTADINAGTALYGRLSQVDEHMKEVRQVVINNQIPQKHFVQANTVLSDGKVTLKEYEPTAAGLIRSWGEREV